ncbi:hypothetical protein SAMN02745196_00416 [Clostridium collagenovorans DSM 3089]|uniref:Uncharacterized protein n=1 Tax=Clostridium collagenovorans DSM 3089 TaxID=1121306 RepID=A0A1M5T2Z8_9CLOT|nr:hypothetical protein [Clostridium collagenovorans]SHH45115.1 hypothetical protein SAMN02745196_00416 [Clostridium collagenovorans DSM 3089]
MRYGEFMPYWYIKEKSRNNMKALSILIVFYGIVVIFSFMELLECKEKLLNIKTEVQSYRNTLDNARSRKEKIEQKLNAIKEIENLSISEKSYEIKFLGEDAISLNLKNNNLNAGKDILEKIKETNKLKVKRFTLGEKENNYNLEMELKY